MTIAFTSPGGARTRPRAFVAALLAGLLAGLALGPATPALAQASMAGTWTINGNGYTGGLGLHQGPYGELGGSMYAGDPVQGFLSSGSRVAVLLRGPQTAPTQAFIGELSPNGNEWRGTFYALTAAMGATSARNAFGFRAVRGQAGYVYYSDPVFGPPAAPCLAPQFTVHNRPSEYAGWTFALSLVNPAPPFGCITGEFSGTIAGDPIYGHYAPETGSLVFLRMNGGLPAQVYVGQVSGGYVLGAFNPQRIEGSFYALTLAMGAGAQRLRYDWSATQ